MNILFSLLICLCLSLPTTAQAASRTLTATVFPVWLLLREVAQDVPDTEVCLLLPAGSGCPHDYAMTPADRRTLARADVLVLNGLGLESFLGNDEKISTLLKPQALIVRASHGVQGILPREKQGHAHDHGKHAEGACSGDPHLFASPSMMARMARSIAGQLAEIDSDHATQYTTNGERTAQRLETLAAECRSTGDTLKSRSIITQHSVFDYLARDIGLTVEAHIQSHEGQEPSARGMLELVRLIRAKGVAAVVAEPQYPARAGRTLAAETGIPCITLDPAANGPDNIPQPLDWYENIMRANLRTLEQALGTR